MKRFDEIPLAIVIPSNTARPIDPATVESLAESMQKSGLLQPVVVQETKIMRGGVFVPGYRVVAGHHRIAAARNIGWQVIQALVLDESISYIEAELMEIDENLCRAEFTPAQRAAAIKRRKQIWEALHPEGGRIPPTSCTNQVRQFAADTAAVSGESKRRINEHLSRAEALGDDLLKVAGTSLDKGVELDALKGMPAEQRATLITRAQLGEKVSARAPAARISLTIEYFDVHDGASSIARAIILRDRQLAVSLLDQLNRQLLETA